MVHVFPNPIADEVVSSTIWMMGQRIVRPSDSPHTAWHTLYHHQTTAIMHSNALFIELAWCSIFLGSENQPSMK